MATGRPRLEGKVAIVTGAGSSGPGVGSGKAMSVLFAREGAKVLLMDQVEARAQETLAMIKEEKGQASIFIGDITKAKDCEAAANTAVQRFGGLHILVNNVGITKAAGLMTVTEEDWDLIFAVNLKAMMLMCRYAIPKMIQSGGGSIVNISSIGAFNPGGGNVAYNTSKGGVNALTMGIAVEEGKNGIRANCIMPGLMDTPMIGAGRQRTAAQEEERNTRLSFNPLHRRGTAWDIAAMALFFASDDARWVTGTAIPVDGGLLATRVGWTPG